MVIGFSTGAIAKGDFRAALAAMRSQSVRAVELSALREAELSPLMEAVPNLDLSGFEYVSVHAPSRRATMSDRQIVDALQPAVERAWPIVVHPDSIGDFSAWRDLESLVLIENTDGRKAIGRSAGELLEVFSQLPKAGLCLDIGHARQIDPTMVEAQRILVAFGDRLAQLHVSEVDSTSKHRAIGGGASLAYQSLFRARAVDVPAILESPVSPENISEEIEFAYAMLCPPQREVAA
jgi:Xylose isomerase-like TIM barrel